MRAHGLLLSSALFAVGIVGVSAQAQGVREVSASERTLISLTTKLRYTTMILLPEQDEILDVVCGDGDFWDLGFQLDGPAAFHVRRITALFGLDRGCRSRCFRRRVSTVP